MVGPYGAMSSNTQSASYLKHGSDRRATGQADCGTGQRREPRCRIIMAERYLNAALYGKGKSGGVGLHVVKPTFLMLNPG